MATTNYINTDKLTNGQRVFAGDDEDRIKPFDDIREEKVHPRFSYMCGYGKTPAGTGVDGQILYQYRLMDISKLESFFITEVDENVEVADFRDNGKTKTVRVRGLHLEFET